MRRLGGIEYLKYIAKESQLTKNEILFINFDDPNFAGIDFSHNSSKREEFIDNIIAIINTDKIKLVLLDEIQD